MVQWRLSRYSDRRQLQHKVRTWATHQDGRNASSYLSPWHSVLEPWLLILGHWPLGLRRGKAGWARGAGWTAPWACSPPPLQPTGNIKEDEHSQLTVSQIQQEEMLLWRSTSVSSYKRSNASNQTEENRKPLSCFTQSSLTKLELNSFCL